MSSSMEGAEKTLKLKSDDDQIFTIKESIAVQCVTLKHMVEEGCSSNTIPIPNVDGRTLALLLEYLKLHGDSAVSGKDKEKFDAEFVDRPTQDLAVILLAANYLETKCLMNFLLDTIADRMKDMSVEEIRETFNVENDYTSDEEKELHQKYEWAF